MKYDVTLITPTGDRLEAFDLCCKYVQCQDFNGKIQWIIVNDGNLRLFDEGVERFGLGMRSNNIVQAHHVRRKPQPDDPEHTLCLNLLTALEHVESDIILFIEDDDWYAPDYVSQMVEALQYAPIAGEPDAIYYHVGARGWWANGNDRHASLCQTGIRRELLPKLKKILESEEKFIDIPLWAESGYIPTGRIFLRRCIGIKGMPGRQGIGAGHNVDMMNYDTDPDAVKLRELIGDDADNYLKYAGVKA